MATLVFPRNLQKIEYNATTAEGPCHVTVVNGTMDVNLQASAPAAGGSTTERGSFKALLHPALTAGQFRRAVGRAFLGTIPGPPRPTGGSGHLFPPPTLSECRHRGLARCRVAVWRSKTLCRIWPRGAAREPPAAKRHAVTVT